MMERIGRWLIKYINVAVLKQVAKPIIRRYLNESDIIEQLVQDFVNEIIDDVVTNNIWKNNDIFEKVESSTLKHFENVDFSKINSINKLLFKQIENALRREKLEIYKYIDKEFVKNRGIITNIVEENIK